MDRRTALITGCSARGLGSELALALHKLGWTIIASARDLTKLEHLQEAGIDCIPLDVVSAVSIEAAVSTVGLKLNGKPLDMLVNNACAGLIGSVIDSEPKSAHDIFNLNFFSIIELSKAFLPLLQASSRPTIVNHTSLGSIFATPSLGVYNASKSAAAMITRILRMELKVQGIKVIDLKTGRVHSRFFENAALRTEEHSRKSDKRSLHQLADGLAMENTYWASQVAKELSQRDPPNEIWRGGVYLARFACLLPTWIVDWGASVVVSVPSEEQKAN